MTWIVRTLCWVAFLTLAPGVQAADAVAGTIKKVEGAVSIVRGGATISATPGTPVLVGDRIRTAADGTVGLALADDTLLSTGPNTELVISAFQFNPTTQEGNLLARLLRGSLHVVTGLIGKISPQNMSIQTPSVVLGVRGTEFIVQTEGEGA